MRIVGKNAAAAREHVQAEAKANRKVTRRGIVRHVTRATPKRAAPKAARPAPRSSAAVPAAWVGAQARVTQMHTRMVTALEAVTDGPRRTDRELRQITGFEIEDFLKRVRLIPWLSIDRTPAGTIFTIDQVLRDICEGRIPRPTLEGFTWRGFLSHVRAEITRRRKENNDLFHSRSWRSDLIDTRKQSNLLDWVEEQLARIP